MLSAVIVVDLKKKKKKKKNYIKPVRQFVSSVSCLIISAESQQTASHVCMFTLPGVVASIKKNKLC